MRVLSLLLPLAVVAGCTTALPKPDPSLAWVELSSPTPSVLTAQRLDGERWAAGRYFEVAPGQHELLSYLSFDFSPGLMSVGRESRRITCEVRVKYDDFQAGQRYELHARPVGLGARASLRGQNGQWLAKGKVTRCGGTF